MAHFDSQLNVFRGQILDKLRDKVRYQDLKNFGEGKMSRLDCLREFSRVDNNFKSVETELMHALNNFKGDAHRGLDSKAEKEDIERIEGIMASKEEIPPIIERITRLEE